MLIFSTIASVAIGLTLTLGGAQSRGIPPTGAGSYVVSPAVVATSITHADPSGQSSLDLLVLWRGTPGWFSGGKRGGSSTWGESAAGRPGSPDSERSQGVVTHQFSFGRYSLSLRFDRDVRTLLLQGMDLALEGANVVLVDGVDSPVGPTVIGTRRIDWETASRPVRVEPLLRETPELLAFLRCDATLSDPSLQALVSGIVCRTHGK